MVVHEKGKDRQTETV